MFSQRPTDDLDAAVISTGSLRMDYALATGGILPGELVIVEGPTGSGKSVVSQHIVAEAQQLGGLCAWIDSDHSFDPQFAVRCGVDPARLWMLQPPDVETVAGALFDLTFSRSLAVIVLDSVDSLVAREELARRLDPSFQPALHPEDEFLSWGLKRIFPYRVRGWTRLVVTRGAIPEPGPSYHHLSARLPRLTLSAQATARIQLNTTRPILRAGNVVGQEVSARIIRPLGVGPTLRRVPGMAGASGDRCIIPECHTPTYIDMMYNQGIVKIGEVFDLGIRFGLIQFRNGCFIYNHRELGPDRETAMQTLDGLDLAAPLEQVLRRKLL